MRRILAVSAALALVFVTAGCLLNRYPSNPSERVAQLQPPGFATASPAALPTNSAANAPPVPSTTSWRERGPAPTGAIKSDPLELRKALAEKKARLHETRAQFYKLEAQRYAVQKSLRDLEAQIADDQKALGRALTDKQRQGEGRPQRKAGDENGQGRQPEKAAPRKGRQGATTPPPPSRFWGAVDRMQSFLGVHFINVYSSDPNRRTVELLNNSEDLRQIEYEWERIWFTDHPSHLTPERVGGPTPP